MIQPHNINIPMQDIESFCRRNSILRLAVFGSATRQDFNAASDIDLLVEFAPGTRLGFDFFRIQDELSKLLGRSVEMTTPDGLRNAYRKSILETAQDIYVAA